MAPEPQKTPAPESFASPDRLWAEQLATGSGLLFLLLAFMAFKHPKMLASGVQVLTTGDLAAYGWYSVGGIIFLLVVHELGTWLVAKHYKLPLKFRLFPFGVNAAAILTPLPRRVWIDASVGL